MAEGFGRRRGVFVLGRRRGAPAGESIVAAQAEDTGAADWSGIAAFVRHTEGHLVEVPLLLRWLRIEASSGEIEAPQAWCMRGFFASGLGSGFPRQIAARTSGRPGAGGGQPAAEGADDLPHVVLHRHARGGGAGPSRTTHAEHAGHEHGVQAGTQVVRRAT